MRVTIHEVAKAANVSISTVSRVLNGKDRVSEATRRRVQNAIEKLNYQPDLVARAMVTKKTRAIALMIPLVSNEYWARMAEVIQDALWEKDYNLVTYSTGYDIKKRLAFLDMIVDRSTDGIIYASSSLEPDSIEYNDITNRLQPMQLPVIGLERPISGFPCILADNFRGGQLAADHLIRQGHERIAYIGGTRIPTERELGFKERIISHGLRLDDEALMVRFEQFTGDFIGFGYSAVTKLLKAKIRFSAAFCVNDLVAVGAIRALEDHGFRVPDDVSIVGFDDISIASLFRPSLTTVRQPIEQIGKAAANLIVNLVEGTDWRMCPRVVFDLELVVRESTR
ncbi:MAG: LacI family transcriptional regulator [Alicyclobacillus sp.]|nr:LacI family transcriptional regulator [Alicyclobacillus sp.]